MSLAKRIIPCLDVMNGRTVKGIRFGQVRDQGDPVELACRYASEGADELVFLDISATDERRATLGSLVTRIASAINIPFTVGGGISSCLDVERLLDAGCDKVSINSAAVANPDLVTEVARRFGSQCVVVAVDAKQRAGWTEVMTHGGKRKTSLEVGSWVRELAERGAGEILLTSIDQDGVRNGFELELTARISVQIRIPVIASGGAGSTDHFRDVLTIGKADAALAAGVFHDGLLSISQLKEQLRNQKIPVR